MSVVVFLQMVLPSVILYSGLICLVALFVFVMVGSWRVLGLFVMVSIGAICVGIGKRLLRKKEGEAE